MPRLDQAVGGQRRGLATLDDRADNVWRQEGEIDEMSNAALRAEVQSLLARWP